MSKDKSKQLIIIGDGISQPEAERIKHLFGAEEVKWIVNGDNQALQVAINNTENTFLLKKGEHHMGILRLHRHQWHTFHKEGGQLVVSSKVPVGFKEVLRVGIGTPVAAST